MSTVGEENLIEESALRFGEIQIGHWKIQVSGPELCVQLLRRVLQSLALPDDNLPSLLVTIVPDGRHATGALQGGLQWSVELPQRGWLSVLAGQVVASATALLQRYLFIHAGAVAVNGRGFIIIGKSGAGKTSTVAALLRRGATYFSDEVALLDPTTSLLHPFTLPMAVKPWTRKAAGRLPMGEHIAKDGRVQFLLPARAAIETAPVEAFVLLKPARGYAQFTSVTRAEMLMHIAMNTSSFTYPSRSEAAFAGFGRLLQRARCYVWESSSPASTVERFEGLFFKSAPSEHS